MPCRRRPHDSGAHSGPDSAGRGGPGIVSQTEFDVCLVVDTASTALRDVEEATGIKGAHGSHDMGAPHIIKSRGVWRTTVWQLSSGCPRTIPLEEQFAAVESQLAPERLRRTGTIPTDARVYFSLGIFADAQVPTANLTPRILAIATEYGADIELKIYSPDMNT
jgi:hypothetical protein